MLMSGDPGEASLTARANIFCQADWHTDTVKGKKLSRLLGTRPLLHIRKKSRNFEGHCKKTNLYKLK